MKLILAKIGKDPTITFAQQELERYLRQIDPSLFLDCRAYERKDDTRANILWIGLDGSVVADHRDEISIQVKNGAGIITGSNPRSVLMAVYRFLQELGCRFLFPGKEGEILPARKLTAEDLTCSVAEKPSYLHRTICIEGGTAFEHVRDMIDWIPKAGMNGYFVQFPIPFGFFKRFYNGTNPYFSFDPVTPEDTVHIWSRLEEEVIRRGLDYHAMGHGWTCEPFGLPTSGWTADSILPEEVRPYLAEINGKRDIFNNRSSFTNLCYSNPVVRQKMIDTIVQYCQTHPAVNYLHFWLADGINNHCECPECQTMRPSDWYVKILNELDETLTAAGITTKIVCLIYVDLLWEPQVEKVRHPERFVLMFAPITRTYSSSFAELDTEKEVELSPYVRNKLTMPKSVEENVARLRHWQTEQLSGESFDFDYHLMWDHYRDPGYYECARILHQDMTHLDKIGLDGMVSCQITRCSFPTGLPMYAMAKGLWDKTSTFEEICTEYFTTAYGDLGKEIEIYLATLSKYFNPKYLRGEQKDQREQQIANLEKAKEIIRDFSARVLQPNAHRGYRWKALEQHGELYLRWADMYLFCMKTDDKEIRKQAIEKFCDFAYQIEVEFHEIFDSSIFKDVFSFCHI